MGLSTGMETDDFIDDSLTRPLQIVYRDEHLVGVFKPCGLVVHRGSSTLPGEPILLQALRDQLGCHVYPVHRLDRPTAGLILFGLSGTSAAKMVDLFTRRRVTKHYQALVCGQTPEQGAIHQPLHKHSDEQTLDHKFQQASTEYLTLARFAPKPSSAGLKGATTDDCELGFSLLEIQPLTGRTHQIRRHLQHIGHPVVGDQRYGNTSINPHFYQRTAVFRMLLTSMRLDFRPPYSNERVSIMTGRGSQFDQAVDAIA